MNNYIVATTKPWNIKAFHKKSPKCPGNWHLITDPSKLTLDYVTALAPKYIFFPHWSWIVCEDILNAAECVCFHASDVPYGRGGSPIQNLIERGHQSTMLTALRMTTELDAGPVYLKCPLSLDGNAQTIFEKISTLVWKMIRTIIDHEPVPTPQTGTARVFKRRTPEQSALPDHGDLKILFDHIRMLDADTYPKAYIQHGEFRIEIGEAKHNLDTISAQITIQKDVNKK